ncbi:hypothetical protein FM036_20025 [Nostoc sp. HG1]|nr:hypothetical protein [Nostoc sp. HG1]
MPFQKKHKLGFLTLADQALDPKPLTLKVRVGVREKVKSIPDWQNELREVIETWIEKKFDPRNKV